MSKPVLFASERNLMYAENIRALYDAYQGEKEFVQARGRRHPKIRTGDYGLLVIDEYPAEAPGKCIRIQHGIQGGKTIGFDQPTPFVSERNVKLITKFVVAGRGIVPAVAKSSHIPESSVVPLGFPNSDNYIGKRKGDGGTFLSAKRSYLFTPTFRLSCETRFPSIDWAWIDSHLSDDEVLAVKAHDAMKDIGIGKYRHIVEIPYTDNYSPYLYDCDVLITDYSSLMFNGMLLKKPVILFEKNPGYTETRGMYLKYPDQYSSRYATNEHELLLLMRDAYEQTETEKECIRYVADMCDGHACERICKLIDEVNNDEWW